MTHSHTQTVRVRVTAHHEIDTALLSRLYGQVERLSALGIGDLKGTVGKRPSGTDCSG